MAIRRIKSNRNSIVVKKLRDQKLRDGLPFMINVNELSSNECYLEYPNGDIKLISITPSSREFKIIKELNTSDANNLRKRLNFSE
ncbi:MAG: hypothetical protein ACOVLC_04105 [Flavobacterium sp.]